MKYIQYISFFAAVLFLTQCTKKVADIPAPPPTPESPKVEDFRAEPPEPAPARPIEIGDYETFTLDNGLQVIVVENHKIPRLSYQLTIDRDPLVEGDKAGLVSIVGDLLKRGTSTKTKSEIDEAIDFVGGSLSTYGSGGYAASLTKHSDLVLSLLSEVILDPSFPAEEFDKIKTQLISGLQAEKDDPNAISSNVSSALVYGKGHPYGEITTEETVNHVTLSDCKKYYDTYFKPDISYMVVVGDVTPDEARRQVEQYFGDWQPAKVKDKTYDLPRAPEKTEVDFVDKTGAVQSVINITYPVELYPGSEDVMPVRVMNTILGSGFSGRLFRNLREDKAYTYGAYSRLSSDKLVSRFSASASVRNEVTDSAVTEFLYELNRMRSEPVTAEELELAKNYIAGNFAQSLERPQTVASFALNTIRYDLPDDYYSSYLERLESITVDDVMAMAKKYIHPDRAHIVVVGNQDEVAEKLSKFGKVSFYDIYGNEKAAPDQSKIDVSAEEVIENYISAIGGKETLKKVTSLVSTGSMDMMGQPIDITISQLRPDKYNMTMTMSGSTTVMRQVFDGERGVTEQMGQSQPADEATLEEMKKQADPFPELHYISNGYELKVTGTEDVNGEMAYKMTVKNDGGTTTEFYSVETGLKLKSIQTQENMGQSMTISTEFSDYKDVSGIKIPHTLTTSGATPAPMEMNFTEYEINGEIDEDVFIIE